MRAQEIPFNFQLTSIEADILGLKVFLIRDRLYRERMILYGTLIGEVASGGECAEFRVSGKVIFVGDPHFPSAARSCLILCPDFPERV